MLLTTHKGVEYCTRRRTRIFNVMRSNRRKRREPVKRRTCLVCARKENIPPYNDMIMLTIHEGNKRSPPPNLREECNRCISEELSWQETRFSYNLRLIFSMQVCITQNVEGASKVYPLHQKRSIITSSDSVSTKPGIFSSG